MPAYAGRTNHAIRRGWSESSVRNVLASETYAGIWHHGKSRTERKAGKYVKKTVQPREQWIGVAVPAIIDAETFARARARAERNKASASRNRRRPYLFAGMMVCEGCSRMYSGSTTPSGAVRYRCGGRCERDQCGAYLCRMPYYTEKELDAAIWPWLTSILREPEQAIRAAQAQAEQQSQADRLSDRLTWIETKLADVRRRIANLDDQLEVEIDDESRSALRERKAQRVKTRRELETERADLIAHQERSPWTCQNRERFIAWCKQTARQTEPATPEKKRQTYELANLQVRLEVKDGLKLAHVTCIVGEQTLELGSIANGALRCPARPI